MRHLVTPADRVQALIDRYGCLPPGPDGPKIEEFSPGKLADAIEQELERCAAMGWAKLTLHMDAADARKLANHLRGK